jgi:hypothetical protein
MNIKENFCICIYRRHRPRLAEVYLAALIYRKLKNTRYSSPWAMTQQKGKSDSLHYQVVLERNIEFSV